MISCPKEHSLFFSHFSPPSSFFSIFFFSPHEQYIQYIHFLFWHVRKRGRVWEMIWKNGGEGKRRTDDMERNRILPLIECSYALGIDFLVLLMIESDDDEEFPIIWLELENQSVLFVPESRLYYPHCLCWSTLRWLTLMSAKRKSVYSKTGCKERRESGFLRGWIRCMMMMMMMIRILDMKMKILSLLSSSFLSRIRKSFSSSFSVWLRRGILCVHFEEKERERERRVDFDLSQV